MLGLVLFFLALVAADDSLAVWDPNFGPSSLWYQAAQQAQQNQNNQNNQNKRVGTPNPLVTVDETGQGSIAFPLLLPTATIGIVKQDPGPGGLSNALTFNLFMPPAINPGDVFLIGPLGNTVNVIRFNPATTGYNASLLYYSLTPQAGSCIADTGFPTSNYGTQVTLTVGCPGVVTYTPTDVQPGHVPPTTNGYAVTYQLNGCTADVCTAGTE